MSVNRIANIIVATTNKVVHDSFSKELDKHSYNVTQCDDQTLEKEVLTSHPDLIVIDVANDGFDGFKATESIKKNPKTCDIPIVLMDQEKSEELYEKAIQVNADDIYITSQNIEEFFVHIKPLLRLSTMFTELENRVALAKEMGVEASNELAADEDDHYNILMIAPQDGDRATLQAILEGKCDLDICDDYFEAEDKLTDGFYDAVISNFSAENSEIILGLSARIRNNPRLFNLPVLLLSDGSLNDPMEAYRRGVTRIVQRPVSHSSLKAKVIMLVRRQRLRWNIRKAIDTTRHEDLTDSVTKAYNNLYFSRHLDQQIEYARTWQKHMAVIFFSIPNIPQIREQFEEAASQHLLKQIYQWIAGLTRVEDLVSRAGDHEFYIALPDTPLVEAQIVMHRIAGILSYTDFAVNDVFQPLSVWVESGITAVEPGDTAANLIDRVRSNID